MKSIQKIMSAAAALSTLAFVGFAAPPALAGGYCSVNTSGMRACGYATLEQCKATMSGGLGSCMSDPFSNDANAKLKSASTALAYQPTRHRAHRHRAPQ